jgi:Tfp pilus assembly protein FimT
MRPIHKIHDWYTKGIVGVKRAFTIVELIVVVGIFTLIMTVALWNQKDLSNSVLITNLAYEVALAVREAQAYGIGVRADTGANTTDDFQGGFGIYANLSNTQQLILFNDKNGNQQYDADPVLSETFIVYNFQNQRGNRMTAICAAHTPLSTHGPCTPTSGTGTQEVNIMFKRPNPEATFYAAGSPPVIKGPVFIVLNTPSGNNCRAVVVETTGQIHIENAQSPVPACSNSN